MIVGVGSISDDSGPTPARRRPMQADGEARRLGETGAMDRPTMKRLKGADRRLPICFSLLSIPSLHPSSRISAAGAFSMLPAWQPLPQNALRLSQFVKGWLIA